MIRDYSDDIHLAVGCGSCHDRRMRRSTKAERAERDRQIDDLVRQDKTAVEIATELKIGVQYAGDLCKAARVRLGLLPEPKKPRAGAKNDKSRSVLKEQLAVCERELGSGWVLQVLATPDAGKVLEGVELQRLYAALRVVLLDADPLIAVVRARFKAIRRAHLESIVS